MELILATRKSALAQTQTETVMKLLKDKENIDSKKLLVVTEGDKRLDVSLNKIGGKGLFTKDIEIALLENLQREDLNFIEESLGYENLIKEHNFTQQQLAEKLGKNQSTIANKLRILKLPDTVKQYLIENGLTERHARALLKLPNEELMMDIVQKVVKLELTVKKTEKLINDTIESLKAEEEPEKKQNIKCSMSMKLYVNTLKQAYDAIINTGIDAKYNEIDKGDYMEVVVKIPKK